MSSAGDPPAADEDVVAVDAIELDDGADPAGDSDDTADDAVDESEEDAEIEVREEPVASLDDIDDRLALDDHTGALQLARKRQEFYPDEAETARLIRRCEHVLRDMYLGKLGDAKRRVTIIMTTEKMRWLSLDHRAGFLISRIVDPTTLEELLDICGMPVLDALAVLCELQTQKVIELVDS